MGLISSPFVTQPALAKAVTLLAAQIHERKREVQILQVHYANPCLHRICNFSWVETCINASKTQRRVKRRHSQPGSSSNPPRKCQPWLPVLFSAACWWPDRKVVSSFLQAHDQYTLPLISASGRDIRQLDSNIDNRHSQDLFGVTDANNIHLCNLHWKSRMWICLGCSLASTQTAPGNEARADVNQDICFEVSLATSSISVDPGTRQASSIFR